MKTEETNAKLLQRHFVAMRCTRGRVLTAVTDPVLLLRRSDSNQTQARSLLQKSGLSGRIGREGLKDIVTCMEQQGLAYAASATRCWPSTHRFVVTRDSSLECFGSTDVDPCCKNLNTNATYTKQMSSA
jgi:hypothetical protein